MSRTEQVTSALAAARRIVPARARQDRLGLLATFLMVTLATALLAAGPIVSDAVTTAGLQARIRQAPLAERGVQVDARLDTAGYDALDDEVRTRLRTTLVDLDGPVQRRGRTGSLRMEGHGADDRQLTRLAFLVGLEEQVRLVDGAAPDPSGTVPQALLPIGAADALGLAVGDTVRVVATASTDDLDLEVAVAGVYEATDPTAAFWWEDPLPVTGVVEGQTFTTYGPFVLDEATFRELVPRWEASWYAQPDVSALTLDGAPPLQRRVAGLQERLNTDRSGNDALGVSTGLDELVADARRALTSTQAGVLVTMIQVGAVAAYALLVAVGLLVGTRQVETALLRARGAGVGQLTGVAVVEGLAVTVPAVLLAPLLATGAVELIGAVGPVAEASLRLSPAPSATSLAFAAAAGVASLVVLVLPALASSRTYMGARASTGRQGARTMVQRAGVDLVLAAGAVLAMWQLRRYGVPLTAELRGSLGVDPLLVLAPALGLLAGAVLTLRLLPVAGRLAEVVVPRGRGLAGAVPAWQLARRPQTLGRAALLLTLAVAISVFAATYARTWSASQVDQADFAVGADVRVEPAHAGNGPPAPVLPDAYRTAGADTVMATAQLSTRVSGVGTARLLALDGPAASAVVRVRDDLAGTDPATLADARPRVAAVPLPSETTSLSVRLRVVRSLGQEEPVRLGLVLADDAGRLHDLDLGDVPADGGWHEPRADLTTSTASGTVTSRDLSLVGLRLRVTAHSDAVRTAHVEIPDVIASTPSGDVPVALGRDVHVRPALALGLRVQPTVADESTDGDVVLVLGAGQTEFGATRPVSYLVTPGPPPAELAPLPLLATDAFLAETGLSVGDRIELPVSGITLPSLLGGRLPAFPTLPTGAPGALVADLPTLSATLFARTGEVLAPEQFWLDAADGNGGQLAAALRQPPFSSDGVTSREERLDAMRNDPAALGIIAALALGAAAAIALAVLGFAVSTVGSARERHGDLAILKALGASRRLVRRWLLLEAGAVLVFSLLLGMAIALAMAYVTLPAVSATVDGARPFPVPEVAVPAVGVALAAGIAAAGLLVVPWAVARHVNATPVARVLRVGEGQ